MLDILRGLGWTSRLPPSRVRWVQPVEWVGRAAVFIIPVFYRFGLGTAASMLAGEVMLVALAFYYTGWARYFTRGRTPELLYMPLFGMPLPLAVSPVVYFLAASAPMRSVPLAVAAVVFGVAHVAISRFEFERILSRVSALE